MVDVGIADDDDGQPAADVYDIRGGMRDDLPSTPEANATHQAMTTALAPTRAATPALNSSTAMQPTTGVSSVNWPKLVLTVAQYGLLGYGAYALYKGKKTRGGVSMGLSLAIFLSSKYYERIRNWASA
jgi:hypothetical protein